MDKIHRARKANKSPYSRGRSAGGIAPSNGRQLRTPRRGKIRLSKADEDCQTLTLRNIVCDFCLAMLADLRDLQPGYGYVDYIRDCKTVTRRIAAEGIQFATICLPVFLDGLLGYLETGKSDFPGFRKPKATPYPHFLRGLVAPIYAGSTSSLAVKNIKLVYQFCAAFEKLQGTANEKVLGKQLADFVQTDIDLSNVDFSHESARDIARDARNIIGEVTKGLNPFDPEQAQDFRPRPGPGACNTPLKHAHRFRPWVWYSELMSVFNPDEWFKPPFAPPLFVKNRFMERKWWEDCPRSTRIGRRSQKAVNYFTADQQLTSRFKFVPKTFTKMRGICIEENEVQWHQQGIRRAMYKRIEHHPLTRGYVNFTSQQVNRELALKGSINGEWATIDMSSASDRISRKLVSYLFGENKELLLAIEACSTETVKIPKVKGFKFIEFMPVKKIAPMGSAICFPIMALVHFALIKAILNRSSIARSNTRDVYVYGDDIIVRRSCTQAIYDYLPLFGMKINTDKSFSRGYFRESCGLHAYKGVEVTPVRFKTVLTPTSSPQDLATALRLEESFYYKGYHKVAGMLRQSVLEVSRKYGINTVPYVNTKSPMFGFFRANGDAFLMDFVKTHNGSWRRSKFRKRLRYAAEWSTDLCTWIYHKVAMIVDKFDEKSSFLDEEDRYLRYLVQDGQWASNEYDEGYSRNTMFRKKDVIESALGYRC